MRGIPVSSTLFPLAPWQEVQVSSCVLALPFATKSWFNGYETYGC